MFDLLYLMLGCFTTLPTSCCLVFSIPEYQNFVFWSFDSVFMKPSCLIFSTSCYVAWGSLSHVRFFAVFIKMLGCLIFSASCHAAGPSLCMLCCLMFPIHAMLFDLVFKMQCCLIFSTSSRLPGPAYVMLCCFIFTKSCYDDCSCLQGATLLDLLSVWSSSYHVMLFDLVFVMPSCLIFSTECHAAGPSLPYITLLDVPYII